MTMNTQASLLEDDHVLDELLLHPVVTVLDALDEVGAHDLPALFVELIAIDAHIDA